MRGRWRTLRVSSVTATRRPAPLPKPSTARIIRPPRPRRTTPKRDIYVRRVRGMGRGVFAGRRFRRGEVIEVCPVIFIPRRQERKCRGELLEKYIFHWPDGRHGAAIALGYGSIYNHSA